MPVGQNRIEWFGYAWTVLLNLITTAVVVAIYRRVNNGFETIIVSLLVLIYFSIAANFMLWGQARVDAALGLDFEFKRIRKLLNNEPTEDETEEFEESKMMMERVKIKRYINAGFLLINGAIVIVNLFGAL